MFDTICTLSLPSDLFAQALHPSEPIVTVGLSSGHVYAYRLPSDNDDEASPSAFEPTSDSAALHSNSPPSPTANGLTNGTGHRSSIISSFRRFSSASENGLGSIDTLWKTRRHKGSCRTLAYSLDGSSCFSAGIDGLIKQFDTQTGRVTQKWVIPLDEDGEVDGPTVLKVVGEHGILLGTDSGRLELRDMRDAASNAKPGMAGLWNPHGDEHVNDLILLPASETSTSGVPKQCVSVGGTTLAVTDFRKGVISTSEDQEVELTSICLVAGLKKSGTSVGEKVLVGQGDGVVSLWERGVWGDLDERVVVDKSGSGVESLVEVPRGFGKGKLKPNEKIVAAGLEDGRVRFVRVGRNGVLGEWDIKHDDIEGVVGLGFDVAGRLVSGGGQTVKVWTEATGAPGGGRTAKRSLEDDDDDDDSGEEASEEEEQEDSSDDERPQAKRKKRKRNKGKDKSGGLALNFSGIL